MVKKSICIITTIGSSLEQFVIPSARELKNHGFEVSLMASMDEKFIEKYKTEFCLLDVSMERGAKPLGMIKAIRSFYKIFKKNKFAIIQYATPNAAFYGAVAGWLAGIKARIYCQWGIRYVGFDGMTRKLFRLIEKITCVLSTTIRSASELNLQFAVEEGLYKTSKAKVIGKGGAVGVDLSYFDSAKRAEYKKQILKKYPALESKFIFGFVGRIDKDKGVNELIEVFRTLRQKYNNIALMIVGPFDKPEGINASLLEYAHNSEDVIFTGYSDKIPQYMSAMDVMCHPTYREGFGLVILQAMAMKTPVITTNIPGASETIENNISGLLCTARDKQSLEEAMELLYRNDILREKFTIAAKQRVKQYFTQTQMSQDIVADREDIFNALISK